MSAEARIDPAQESLAAFLRELPELYRTNPEQWVAYRGGERLGIGQVRHLLYQQCFDAGLQRSEFVIFGIVPQETELRLDPFGGS